MKKIIILLLTVFSTGLPAAAPRCSIVGALLAPFKSCWNKTAAMTVAVDEAFWLYRSHTAESAKSGAVSTELTVKPETRNGIVVVFRSHPALEIKELRALMFDYCGDQWKLALPCPLMSIATMSDSIAPSQTIIRLAFDASGKELQADLPDGAKLTWSVDNGTLVRESRPWLKPIGLPIDMSRPCVAYSPRRIYKAKVTDYPSPELLYMDKDHPKDAKYWAAVIEGQHGFIVRVWKNRTELLRQIVLNEPVK